MNDSQPCHGKETPKLNRVSGQIDGIKKMIDDGRYCPDILVQLRAARAALRSIESNILESHLNACVVDVIKSGDQKKTEEKIAEVKEIFKRFND